MPQVRKGLPKTSRTDSVTLNLHPIQMEIVNSPARFKIVVAGRRGGKTVAACALMLKHAAQRPDKAIFYVAPSFEQGKRAAWDLLKRMAGPLLEKVYESEGYLVINGVNVYFRGADRPDLMRGVGLSLAVLDEYASMKPSVWSSVLRPALIDAAGSALFIGSPAGKNHFYDLYRAAEHTDGWQRWRFSSYDNPFLKKEEIEGAISGTSSSEARREIYADFNELGGERLKEEWFRFVDTEPADGEWLIALDPAGFVTAANNAEKADTDSAAIAVVKAAADGLIWVRDIYAGRWGVSETVEKLVGAMRSVPYARVGIEKGALKNAIDEELARVARSSHVPFTPEPLSNGGRNKQQRLAWALESGLEHGRIVFRTAPWNRELVAEAMDFPAPRAHDDRLDALAYAIQMARGGGDISIETTDWT